MMAQLRHISKSHVHVIPRSTPGVRAIGGKEDSDNDGNNEDKGDDPEWNEESDDSSGEDASNDAIQCSELPDIEEERLFLPIT